MKRIVLPVKLNNSQPKIKHPSPFRPALVQHVLMTPPKPFTQLFLEQPANLTGRHQHVDKQPGGKGCLQAMTGWPFPRAGSGRQATKNSLVPQHAPLSSKEIPQPHGNHGFPETPGCARGTTGSWACSAPLGSFEQRHRQRAALRDGYTATISTAALASPSQCMSWFWLGYSQCSP